MESESPADHDAALRALSASSTVEERLNVLRLLIADRHGPLKPGDGVPAASLQGLQLPYPLKWWYESAGARSGIISGFNHLVSPQELKPNEHGHIVFYYENQGVYEWATRTDGDDPPVWGRFPEYGAFKYGAPWTLESFTLSEFLIQACLFELLWFSPFGAVSEPLSPESAEEIWTHIPRLALGPWRWPDYPTCFHAGNGVVLTSSQHASRSSDKYTIMIGAKTERFLNEYVSSQDAKARWHISKRK